jgi:DNA-binding XRE family transcriptional regulator
MTQFRTQLTMLVASIGTARAAKICGVSPRTIQLWMRGEGNPNLATKAGALSLLQAEAAKKTSARRG